MITPCYNRLNSYKIYSLNIISKELLQDYLKIIHFITMHPNSVSKPNLLYFNIKNNKKEQIDSRQSNKTVIQIC